MKSIYNTGIQQKERKRKKHRTRRDGMTFDYLLMACFALLLDDELPCERVGEFDRLPVDGWTKLFDVE